MDSKDKERQIENKKSKLKPKFLEICIAVVLCAVVLVIFCSDLKIFKTSAEKSNSGDFESYVYGLENSVAKTISKIDGVGEVAVMITFETGIQRVYAYESTTTSSGSTKNELILYQGKPVVIKENIPEIKGVVVVAKGAASAAVRLDIVRTIQVLLGVSYDKIEVFTKK